MTGKSETAVPLTDLVPKGQFLRLLHNSATAWAILLCSLLITGVGWYISNKFVQQRAVDRFQFETADIQLAIRNRMLSYEQVLRGGVGLHAASESITRQQWSAYVKKLKINEKFPGIQGLGVSVLIRPEEKAAHLQRIRAEGFPTYTIWPETARAEYHSIIYLEPFEGRNLRAFGYDMFSEPVRRAAMEQARDSGQPTISGLVTLVQETDQDVQHGFLMYWPVYRKGQPQATPAERRRAFIGLVYSPFRMKDLMRGVLGGAPPEIDFEIFDSEQMSPQTLLHDSDERLHLTEAQHHPDFARTTTIKIGERVWTLYFNARPNFLSPADSNQPLLIGLGGLLVDLLLFYIIGSIASLKKRAVALAAQMNGEFRAKNAELEAVMQSFPDLYFWLGADGTIQQYHANRLSDLYLPPEQFIGKTMQEVLPPPLGQRFAATQAQALSSGTVVGIEYALSVADGAKEFEARFAPLQGDRVLAVVRDITARQRAVRRLETQHAVALLLAESAPLADAMPLLLQIICEHLDWDVGEFWSVERAANVLHQSALWHTASTGTAEFARIAQSYPCAPGTGLPGRIWGSRASVWIADLAQDKNFPRAPLAVSAGLRSAFGFPLLSEGEVQGVLVFFSRQIQPPDEELSKVMSVIGSQTGQFIKRKQTEEALRQSEQHLRAIIDATPECVKLIAADGTLLDMNPVGLALIEAENLEAVVGQCVYFLVAPECPSPESGADDKQKRGVSLFRGGAVGVESSPPLVISRAGRTRVGVIPKPVLECGHRSPS